MKTLITSDWHLQASRKAGTTPASQQALQDMLQLEFAKLINAHLDKDVLIAGDLLDNFSVDTTGLLETYRTLSHWLSASAGKLILQAGNHDWSPKGSKTSSFHFLANILIAQFGERVVLADSGLQVVKPSLAVISHTANQDCFNLEVEKALKLEDHDIVVHSNIINNFAQNSDHSLNLDEEQIRKLTRKNRVLAGHEHQHRTLVDGRVVCLGNPMPSSISDCLAHGDAQKDGKKYAWVLDEQRQLSAIETWHRKDDFIQMDWSDLTDTPARFIRVTGTATAAQAAEVISVIAKYRQKSDALIITNGVKVDILAGMDELAEAQFTDVKKVDILGLLLEQLDTEERRVVCEDLLEQKLPAAQLTEEEFM